MRLIMKDAMLPFSGRTVRLAISAGLLFVVGLAPSSWAQSGTNPLNLFKNYFVTGDYVVAGWSEGTPDGSGYAPGTISIPDTVQLKSTGGGQLGVPSAVPVGANIIAAYLYWATVEGNQNSFAGQSAYFNGYAVAGTVLGNPNAPTSWSSGGCSGSAQGSKTMRTYRADVRPFLPIDTNPLSPTFGATIANTTIPVRLADSGSNGNTTPQALGATLVVIYSVLSPVTPLNAVVLYDGVYAPSNAGQTISQAVTGFYEPATSPVAKLTHIVANGQANKGELVYLNNSGQPLPSIYGSLPPFPGIYGTWDNPTWVLNQYGTYVTTTDTVETTSVAPSSTNSGCVSWGAIVMSTTVQDTDGDGLLDVWENKQGYTDAVSNQWVALPGANANVKDLFVEADWLTNMDASAGPYKHSHLPQQATIDYVGQTFANQGVNVHFDVGPGIYAGDPYVIPNGTGGNAISEGLLFCTDGASLCPYPGQPAVGWKGGFELVQNSAAPFGNFQPGRQQSYHYMLFGHSLGSPVSYWGTVGAALADPTIPQLVSIVNSGSTATITIQSPAGTIKPGDCPNAAFPDCADANNTRITITGALGQTALNGSYLFGKPKSVTANNLTMTTFTVSTSGVANGPYNFGNEPQLGVSYLGPSSTSGHSDFGGGGDSAITLGLWGADDPANCQPDPSQSLAAGQVYCSNQVGTLQVQIGTVMHELGHTLALTHGGTYYADSNNPSLPSYELNCKPNFLSVMNYLFQVRGFADGGFDYSGQTISSLSESFPSLNELTGIGNDMFSGLPAAHLTRWYSTPNALDVFLQKTVGGRYASSHCDGTALTPADVAAVRVEGNLSPGGTYSGPLDWNNDLSIPDAVTAPGIDINYNGLIGDPSFSGFNDWEPAVEVSGVVTQGMNFQQMAGREDSFGYSAGGIKFGGGGIKFGGGGVDNDGGGIKFGGGGIKFGGGGIKFGGGGIDTDSTLANSTVNPPTGLTCAVAQSNAPACVLSSGTLLVTGKSISLSWTGPIFGQIRKYYVWRAVGSFQTSQGVLGNFGKFTLLATVTGAPPAMMYIDSNLKNKTTYTYFVTDANLQGVQSGASNPIAVTVNF